MKKILLATTMLAGTAGFAAAEVTLSGSAEIGVWSSPAGDLQFWQEVEVVFGLSGTTDGGLEFGASVDLDEAAKTDSDGTDDDGFTVWVSGAFGKVTMGDTDGALDWAVADQYSLTSLADDHTTHVAVFNANGLDALPVLGRAVGQDGQIVRYENTVGDFGFALSLEQVGNGATGGETIWGVAGKYAVDLGGTTLNVGLGHQQSTGPLEYLDPTAAPAVPPATLGLTPGKVKQTAVSVGASFAGGFSGSLAYADTSAGGGMGFDHIGLSLDYASGPLGLNVNYGKVSLDTAFAAVAGFDSFDSWGAAANYDLGGGAKVMFGYASDMDAFAAGDQDQWSLGMGLSF